MAEIPELTKEQWQDHLERLALYALRKFRLRGWAARHIDCAGPKGIGPQDIASEAITRVINGKRSYNSERYPVFMDFLKSIVDSRISQLVESFKRKKTAPLFIVTDERGDCKEIEPEGKEATPVKICVAKDIVEKIKIILKEEFENDPAVNAILECLDAGIEKPTEISELSGVDIKEIYNAQKRLRRAIEQNKKLQSLKTEYDDDR
jgi:hypothetical protein